MAKTAARIAVIGGGIGGLTAAIALRQRGFDVSVYESSPELREIGAGVSLGPNAMKALRSLGLEDQVAAVGFSSEYQVLRNWRTGRIISSTPRQDLRARYGAGGCNVHRADLLDVLSGALPNDIVRLGARCASVESDDQVAHARFTDGTEIEADLIVGADGIHSAVRTSLFGPDAPRFTERICYRGLIPVESVPGGFANTDGATWLGPHGAVVVYLVRRGELVNLVAHYESSTWTEESWIRECDQAELIENYRGWNESLMRLFSSIPRYYKWALYDRDPLDKWSKGRATLLGDAAHAMLPYLGQGACQSMEDGCVLAAALAASPDNISGALEMYEHARVPRARRTVLSARERGVDNHLVSPLAALKRDVQMALQKRFSPDKTGRGAGWLFDYDVTDARLLTA